MGRGQQADVNKEAKSMVATENANANAAEKAALGGYQAEQANPGYTSAEKTGITGATEGGIGAAYGSASEGAANRAARTNNAGGLTSTQDALARQRMITSGNLADQNATNFANARISGSQNANAGIANIFGQNLQGANATLGHQTENAKTPGFWDTFGNSFAGALGKGLVPGGSVGPLTFG